MDTSQINNIVTKTVEEIYKNLPKTIEEKTDEITTTVLNKISENNAKIYDNLLETYKSKIANDFKEAIKPDTLSIFKTIIEDTLTEIVKPGNIKPTNGGGKKHLKKPRKTRKLRKSTL